MSLAKSLPYQCASRATSALIGQRPPCPKSVETSVWTLSRRQGGNVVSLQGIMILASRGFSVIFPQGLTNSMASVVLDGVTKVEASHEGVCDLSLYDRLHDAGPRDRSVSIRRK